MTLEPYAVAQLAALGIAAAAAVVDHRTGRIPSALTLPALLSGLVGYGMVAGVHGVAASALGAAACALVPFALQRVGAMGGGDVKLFAALGAILGLSAGIEAELASVIVASVWGAARLTWRGELGPAVRGAVALVLRPVLPAKWKRDPEGAVFHEVRMGFPILAGTLLAVAARPAF